MALAAPMIALVYLVGTASILLAIPASRASGVYGVTEAVRAAGANLGAPWLLPLGASCVALDRIGSLGLWLGALARLPTSAGISQYLPTGFSRLHPKYRSPANAIWTQAAIVAALVVLGQSGTSVRGAYDVLIEMMVVTAMLPFLLIFAAAIKASLAAPLEGESRIWGGRPVVIGFAVLGALATAGSVIIAFVPPPEETHPMLAVLKIAFTTAVLILAGAGLYALGKRRSAEAPLLRGADARG